MKQTMTRTAFLALGMAVLLPGAEETVAGAKLRALLAASESEEAAARFVEEHFDPGHLKQVPAAAIARQIRAIGRQAGELKVLEMRARGARQAEARIAGTKVKGEMMMMLAVSEEAPHRIMGWGTRPAFEGYMGELLGDAAGTEEARLAAIGKAVETAARDHRFAGAILVARGGKVLLEKAVGPARLDPAVENTLKTKFHLGSMPKMFTATAVLRLAQEGKLKLDAPISEYLPDYPNQEHARKITLHHLLTHTSGLGDYFGPEFDAKKGSIRKLEDYYQFFANKPLRFEPGARWSYSNAGMHLAGIIVERVAGKSYYDAVQELVFDRAGMKATGNNASSEEVDGLAQGYSRFNTPDVFSIDPPTKSNLRTLPPKGGPAGGGYSTLGDLHAFAQALLANRLLDARHTALLTEGKVAIAPGAKYAYGFEEIEIAGRRSIGHSGGAPGMNAVLRVFPETGLTVVVLSNYDPPFAQMLGQKAAEVMARP